MKKTKKRTGPATPNGQQVRREFKPRGPEIPHNFLEKHIATGLIVSVTEAVRERWLKLEAIDLEPHDKQVLVVRILAEEMAKLHGPSVPQSSAAAVASRVVQDYDNASTNAGRRLATARLHNAFINMYAPGKTELQVPGTSITMYRASAEQLVVMEREEEKQVRKNDIRLNLDDPKHKPLIDAFVAIAVSVIPNRMEKILALIKATITHLDAVGEPHGLAEVVDRIDRLPVGSAKREGAIGLMKTGLRGLFEGMTRKIGSDILSDKELIKAKEEQLAVKEAALLPNQLMIEFLQWSNGSLVLEKNDCSRLHTLVEASERREVYEAEGLDNVAQLKKVTVKPETENPKIMVVKHDWAAAFGESIEEATKGIADGETQLPFPAMAFEFRISGHTVLVMAKQMEVRPAICMFFHGKNGWLTFDNHRKKGMEITSALAVFVERQITAICVALDAEVATHEVVRAPAALNAKRAKSGKGPLFDFHVVDLSRRTKSRAARNPNPQPSGVKVRMHFRRGHWRHYQNSTKTWINWMLVGDPDLGFIDKHYLG